MACPDNTKPCGCNETNECGCKVDAKDIVYIGPTLTCTDINNCDNLKDIISNFDAMLCSDEFIQILINNITNNVDLYNQLAVIINNSIDCEVIQNCFTTTSTTTCACENYHFIGPSINGGTAYFVECGNTDATIIDLDDIIQSFCVDNAYPVLVTGLGAANNQHTCCE